MVISHATKMRLSAEAQVDPRTVIKWLREPQSVRRATAAMLERAASDLGVLDAIAQRRAAVDAA